MKPDNDSRLNNSHQQLEHCTMLHLSGAEGSRVKPDNISRLNNLHDTLEHLCCLHAVALE